MRGIFHHFALHNQVVFQFVLAYAAQLLAAIRGQTESLKSINHKTQALHLMSGRLKSDTGVKSDGTIVSALALTTIEVFHNSYLMQARIQIGLSESSNKSSFAEMVAQLKDRGYAYQGSGDYDKKSRRLARDQNFEPLSGRSYLLVH